jgi:hypothetical protein
VSILFCGISIESVEESCGGVSLPGMPGAFHVFGILEVFTFGEFPDTL